MSNILSACILAFLLYFGLTVSEKTESLQKQVVGDIDLNLKDGSICGKDKDNKWVCDSLYIVKLKTTQGK
jgi:hypothetical protein